MLLGEPEEMRPLEDLGLDVEIMFWILGKSGGKVWTRCIWLRIGTSDGIL
jgi:hypothetical protein